MGLGHSQEAVQLQLDATRVLIYEAKVADVNDPWAGSYFMESLTDEIESQVEAEMEKIEGMGGAVAAIENGYMQKAIAKSAYQRQKDIESQKEFVVGVNCFTGQNEINVSVNRAVEATYDPERMKSAERRQVEKLAQFRRQRNNTIVQSLLSTLRNHAREESVNLMPDICECVKNDVSLQEICDALRDVFGEFRQAKL